MLAINLIIRIALKVLGFFSVFSPKLQKFHQGQVLAKSHLQDMKQWRTENKHTKLIWFHCASLGEFEQGRSLIDSFFNDKKYLVLLSFFSPSGYEIRQTYANAHKVVYLPLAYPNQFVKAIQAEAAIFIKYEFWPNFMQVLLKRNISTYFVSVILRPKHYLFSFFGQPNLRLLKKVKQIFVQNDVTEKLLTDADFKNVQLSGDTRFDRVATIASTATHFSDIEAFVGNKKVLVAGSTWEADIALLQCWKNPEFKIIVVPHEIKNIANLQKQLDATIYSEGLDVSKRILIIDAIGILSSLYALADVVYIGGGFGAGLHNILEPASFGKPIYFGNKNYHKFQEALDLIEAGVAFAIGGAKDLEPTILDFFQIKIKAQSYVMANSGATKRVFDYIVRDL